MDRLIHSKLLARANWVEERGGKKKENERERKEESQPETWRGIDKIRHTHPAKIGPHIEGKFLGFRCHNVLRAEEIGAGRAPFPLPRMELAFPGILRSRLPGGTLMLLVSRGFR